MKTDKLDVVVMNNAPLLLNYNIISEGRLLDCKDELERVMFETYVLSRYLDRRYYDERHVKMGIKRMAERDTLREEIYSKLENLKKYVQFLRSYQSHSKEELRENYTLRGGGRKIPSVSARVHP